VSVVYDHAARRHDRAVSTPPVFPVRGRVAS
jgi:hypothetical protein